MTVLYSGGWEGDAICVSDVDGGGVGAFRHGTARAKRAKRDGGVGGGGSWIESWSIIGESSDRMNVAETGYDG